MSLKFVLLFAEREVFCMLLEGNIITVSEKQTDMMKCFDSEVEALLWKEELLQKAGHSLTVGFLDYEEGVPFVESCEFLYRGDI